MQCELSQLPQNSHLSEDVITFLGWLVGWLDLERLFIFCPSIRPTTAMSYSMVVPPIPSLPLHGDFELILGSLCQIIMDISK